MQVCAGSFVALMASRFFFGIWTNSMVTAQVYLSDVSTGLVRTTCMAQLTSIKQLSMFFGPGIGGVLSKYGLSVPILADVVATVFASFFAYAFLVESPSFLNHAEKQEGASEGTTAAPMSGKFMILMIPTFLNAAVLVNMNMTLAIFAQKRHG